MRRRSTLGRRLRRAPGATFDQIEPLRKVRARTGGNVSEVSWAEAMFLGLLQGLTEFLPISSSAHLRIAGPLLPSGGDPGAAFTAITQIGTETAVLLYFRRELSAIALSWWRSIASGGRHMDSDARIGWLILIGTLPIAVLGLLFKEAIETSLRNLYITAAMLIAFALLLWLADRLGAQRRHLRDMGWGHGLLFGLAQALALIPGVSRSGGTITAGLMMGYTREAAARYAFLLAVPAVYASGFYQLWRSAELGSPVAPGPTALATLVAFAVGYGVIVAFMKFISVRSYLLFVCYRIMLGLLVLGLLWAGVLQPL